MSEELNSDDLMWLLLNSDNISTPNPPLDTDAASASDLLGPEAGEYAMTAAGPSALGIQNPVPIDRKRQRKEKNREAARKCRKKRKEEVNSMQEKLKSLEEENVKLRAISAGQVKPEADMMTRKRQLIEELEELLEKDADEQVVMEKIQDYAVKFGSSGDQRRADLKQALDRLEELVRASNAKKLAFFTVEQVDTANAGSQPEGSLSPNDRQSAAAMLFKEIGFTEEQRAKLRSRKLRIQDMQQEIQQSVQMVRNLRSKVEAQQLILSEQMSQLMAILRPAQAAKFLLWIKNNPACMALLQKLWDQKK